MNEHNFPMHLKSKILLLNHAFACRQKHKRLPGGTGLEEDGLGNWLTGTGLEHNVEITNQMTLVLIADKIASIRVILTQ